MNNFYGDQHRWFIGKVIDINDPSSFGRVQVRIYGIHSNNINEVGKDQLPWAKVSLSTSVGGTSGIGNQVPGVLPGATVWGIFMDGVMSQAPLVCGVLAQEERPTITQESNVVASGGDPQVFNTDNMFPDGVVTQQQLRTQYNISRDSIDAKRLIIMMFFVHNGFSSIAAAGITGNLERENSTFDPSRPSSFEGEGSVGLAQWNPAPGAQRLQKLERFAANNNRDPYEFFTQLAFIIHELRGREVRGDGGGAFNGVYRKLERATTFEGGRSNLNSTWVFLDRYENPANKGTEIIHRERFARTAYEQYVSAHQSANPDANDPRGGNA